jgi:microcystin-dependent protein
MGILDNAAIFGSGTVASRPAPSSVVTGYFYLCTDVQIGFVCVAISGTNTWLPISVGGGPVPVGAIIDFAGSTVPADADGVQRWHLCDGSAIARSTYATLFSAIGTTWGTGNGSTTFNIPDFRGRVTVGGGTPSQGSGLSTRALAITGGEEIHVLSAAESGTSNIGSFAVPGNEEGYSIAIGEFTTAEVSPGSGVEVVSYVGADQGGVFAGGLELTASSAQVAHNNMQPFAVANKAIRLI